ncbi:MAG: EamA family transporter [Patescibacteria group bacterium]
MIWFLLVITAVFFIVFETILEKRTLSEARTFGFAAMFAFGNAIISIPFLLVANFSNINWHILIVIYIASLFSTVTSLLIFKAMKHSAISEVAPILALLPLVVSLFAFFILGEKINIFQLSGLILMVLGIMFLEFKNFEHSSGIFKKGRKRYLLYIALCLVLGAICSIFDKAILSGLNINSLAYLAIIQIFIAFNYLIFISVKPNLFPNFKLDLYKFWKVILLISFLAVIHRYLYISAIKITASIGLVVAVYKLSSLFNVFIGKKFFGEDDILKKILATIIILGGVFLLVVN